MLYKSVGYECKLADIFVYIVINNDYTGIHSK